MESDAQNAYLDGARTAREALDAGVPRWVRTSEPSTGEEIDPGTGLPWANLCAPPGLAQWQVSYARGYNDTVSAAIDSGEVSVDFRPLLMTRAEIVRALAEDGLGTLSVENARIEGPNGDFVLELRVGKSKKTPSLTWICYRRGSGDEWPKFQLYDGPLKVALGRDGRVLVFKSECVFITYDAVTTQVLNRNLV